MKDQTKAQKELLNSIKDMVNTGAGKKRKASELEEVPEDSDDESQKYDGFEYFVCLTDVSVGKRKSVYVILKFIVCDGTENGKELKMTFTEAKKKYPKFMANMLEGWATSQCKKTVNELISDGTLNTSDPKYVSVCNIRYIPEERTLSRDQIKERISKIQEGEADVKLYIADDTSDD